MKAIGPPPRPDDYVPNLAGRPSATSRGEGTHIWLVRHATVAEEFHSIAYGAMDVPLSSSGEEATRQMGLAFTDLPVDAVLSSDLSRARELGKSISNATGAPLATSEHLREIHRGEWQGLPKEAFVENWHAQAELYWSDPFRWHTPGGEGDEMIFARAWPIVEATLEAHVGGHVVVTAHSQLNRVLISRMLGIDVPESYEYFLDPAHATRLVDTKDGWSVEASNLGANDLG